MKIQKYLKSVRTEKIKMDLASISFVLLMILTALLVTLILLESVFYFPPFYKQLVLLAITLTFLIIIFTGGIAWLVLPFFANSQHQNTLKTQGYFDKKKDILCVYRGIFL